jgi:osmotically-inducible protein OsmY
MTRFHKSLAVAAAGLLLAAVPATADDAKTQRKIEKRLHDLDALADVRVTVTDGTAVLEGAVAGYEASYAAQKAARKEAKSVDNRIHVLVERRPDVDVRQDVEKAILRYPYYGVFDSVGVGVEDGVVVLEGSVYQPWRKDDIESRVARVEGVRALVNRIGVQDVSSFDESLRRQLVRRIYGSSHFVTYANWPNPPIRIIVNNGHVLLTGYVRSGVEQAMVGHIARGTLSFGVDNQVKVEGDETPEPGAKTTKG